MKNPNYQRIECTAAQGIQIAIVGMGCWYPGAKNPKDLWENILARRRQFRRIPDVRLPLAAYQDDDKRIADKTYGTRAAVVDGYRFDWASHRIPRSTFEATDMAHWLALDVALQMLDDAGYKPADLPQKTTQVIVGNTLTGEFSRSNMLRLRWPFVEKMLRASALRLGMRPEALARLSAGMEHNYKSVFPPVNEDSLAGGLANTIAGRICNYLNVHGGGYTVDGACSSSLLAVYSGVNSLVSGAADFVLAGGVDISLDPFELIGFAKTGALTATEMSVYDKRGNGFIPGEGCGFVGLKRLAEAMRDGNKVYAVLDGCGMSSDGKGGLTAPSVSGQSVALGRAYDQAGIDRNTIDFIEGHGTGTAVGDRTELLAIAKALGDKGHPGKRRCGVTSFKSIAGHTKAAAGIGALIKAAIAVNQRVTPPTAGCAFPHDVFSEESSCLYPVRRGEVHPSDKRLRAGVSAMGFGGINVHVTLTSGERTMKYLAPVIGERAAMASSQDSEVFCLSAASITDLIAGAENLRANAAGASMAELADLAASHNSCAESGLSVKAAVLAHSPEELSRRLDALAEHLRTRRLDGTGFWVDRINGLAAGHVAGACSLGLVFPGQGSQRVDAARVLVQRFEWARALVDDADTWAREAGTAGLRNTLYPDSDRLVDKDEHELAASRLRATQLAQPAIVLASLLWLKYLARVGISADCVMGHSLGELTAFHAAGAFDEKTLIQLATMRGQLMAGSGQKPSGGMLSLACARQRADALIEQVDGQGILVVANLNGSAQTVVSGHTAAIEALLGLAQLQGVAAQRLPVSNAFHSPLVAEAAEQLRERAPIPRSPVRIEGVLISSCDGRPISVDVDMRAHFADQIVKPVDFISAVGSLREHCDMMVEVGPGGVLSRLISQIHPGPRLSAWPVERDPESFDDLNWLLGLMHVHGRRVAWQEVYSQRSIKPFAPAQDLTFLMNPCERPLDGAPMQEAFLAAEDLGGSEQQRGIGEPAPSMAGKSDERARAASSAYQVIVDAAMRLTGYSAGQIHPEHCLSDDLNLDSIKVSTLIEEVCAALGVPGQLDPAAWAMATLEKLAHKLDALVLARSVPATSDRPSAQAVLLELAAQFTGFDRATLLPTTRFADDLNLDSIKMADLISRAQAALGIATSIESAAAATKTIGEVAAEMEALCASNAPGSTLHAPAVPTPARADWVRTFEMRPMPSRLAPVKGAALEYANRLVAIQCDETERDLGAALARRFAVQGARVLIVDDAQLLNDRRTDIEHIVVILPRRAANGVCAGESLKHAIARLRAAAVVSARQARCVSLTYVQFGGGVREGLNPEHGSFTSACASSFAASVHLERPSLWVRVVDLPPAGSVDFGAGRVVDEQTGPETYMYSHYGEDERRYVMVPRLIEPQLQLPRMLSWSERDVVLVTGGAKGITAECAFAFAQATGARMILLGSSPAGDTHGELGQTLSRYALAGLFARYYACDIVDLDAVRHTLGEIAELFGPISAVIHGAGLNRPRRAEQVDEEEALLEVSPKLKGLLNIFDALPEPPKLVAALSSIIGVTGMPGNAWYAFSNEALDVCLRTYQESHPATETVALAYSVWADIGMGAKLGTTKHLAKLGVSAIPLEAGVAHFLQCVLKKLPARQVIIASRLNGLDTWRSSRATAPAANRFLQDIRELEPGVELSARCRLTLENDLYLRDHYYRGVYLFPTVFGLEAMAQSVAHVLGLRTLGSLKITDLELTRPIVVDGEQGAEIEIRAQVMERVTANEPLSVRVGIGTEQTAFQRAHFSGTFVLEEQHLAQSMEAAIVLPASSIAIDPKTELYNGLLFQGPLFQRLEKVWSMDSAGSIITVERHRKAPCFSAAFSQDTILGDPCCRDVLLQSAQLSVKGTLLPIGIDTLYIYSLNPADDDVVAARNFLTNRDANGTTCEVTAVSHPRGEPVERMVGYRLKQMEHAPAAPEPEDWADPQARDSRIFQSAVAEGFACLEVTAPACSLTFRPELSRLDRGSRRVQECPLLQDLVARALAADGQPGMHTLEIHWREDGKPMVRGWAEDALSVSLSHDKSHCVCVAGRGPQGCDLEPIAVRSRPEWRRLLGDRHEALLEEMIKAGDSLDEAGTRIWCALESVTKSLGAGNTARLTLARKVGRSALLSARTDGRTVDIVTLPLSLTRPGRKMLAIAAVAEHARVERSHPEASPAATASILDPPDVDGLSISRGVESSLRASAVQTRNPAGKVELRSHFRVTFKEMTTSPLGLKSDTFALWMGHLRELAIVPVGKELVADFATGQWGMVTNHSSIRVVGPVGCLDLVEGRLRVGRTYGRFGSSVDLQFDWVRIDPDGSEETIAFSDMATTWVEILSHGVVAVRPFPPYIQRLIDGYSSTDEGTAVPAASEAAHRIDGLAPESDARFGREIYLAPRAPRVEPELLRVTFDTASAESNIVGNIYYANYYHWQGRLIDRIFREIAPEGMRSGGLSCVHAGVAHLREAMPYDRVEVVMGLQALHRRGVKLHFDFYRISNHGRRDKLAVGKYEALWRDAATDVASDLPENVLAFFNASLPLPA